MPLRRMIRSFIDPVDARSAANLTRQLADFEENVAGECDDIRARYQQAHKVLERASRPAAQPMVAPGQALGCDTSTADCRVLLAEPEAKFEGQSVIIYKRSPLNFIVLEAKGSNITGAATYSIGNPGRYEVFCDGVEYWL